MCTVHRQLLHSLNQCGRDVVTSDHLYILLETVRMMVMMQILHCHHRSRHCQYYQTPVHDV